MVFVEPYFDRLNNGFKPFPINEYYLQLPGTQENLKIQSTCTVYRNATDWTAVVETGE